MFNFILCDKMTMKTASIGVLNRINAHELDLANGSSIGRRNCINDAYRVILDEKAMIVSGNHIVGTRAGLSPFKMNENFLAGYKTIITVGHRFDLSDTIEIGDNVTFGGTMSEVWTHGFDVNHVKIQQSVTVGSDVYIGSRCIILPGANIVERTSIGAGTVVSKAIDEPGFYVSSQLLRKADCQDYSSMEGIVSRNGANFFRK